MTNITGTNLASGITPFTTDDQYTTHTDIYGCGGLMSVQDDTARNNIPTQRRKEGMKVYEIGSQTYYKLIGGTGNDSWALDTGSSQVQSDWNETLPSAVDYILNKPTIPASQVQTDWNAIAGMGVLLNKPTIPAAQVRSDWNETIIGNADYILNKPTIIKIKYFFIFYSYYSVIADNGAGKRRSF